jgi:BMFP domain-containing protein YqiC
MERDNKNDVFSNMNESLEELTRRISSLIPGDVKHMQDDIENNVRSLLQSSLTKMNLVTREEFDIQSAVLLRTREKLEQLEKQLEQLQEK